MSVCKLPLEKVAEDEEEEAVNKMLSLSVRAKQQ